MQTITSNPKAVVFCGLLLRPFRTTDDTASTDGFAPGYSLVTTGNKTISGNMSVSFVGHHYYCLAKPSFRTCLAGVHLRAAVALIRSDLKDNLYFGYFLVVAAYADRDRATRTRGR